MKKVAALMFWLAFLFLSSTFVYSQTQPDTMTITTYYPAPYGEYQQLRLTPSDPSSVANCSAALAGTIYYNRNDNQIYYCNGTAWLPIGGGAGGFWADASSHAYIYNTNSGNVRINPPTTAYPNSFLGNVNSALSVAGGIQDGQFARLTFGNNEQGNYAGLGALVTNSGSYLYFGTSNNYASGITNAAMTIDYTGNAGFGQVYNPGTAVPNSINPGNIDVNDVYLRSTGQWVSQMGGTGGGTGEGQCRFCVQCGDKWTVRCGAITNTMGLGVQTYGVKCGGDHLQSTVSAQVSLCCKP